MNREPWLGMLNSSRLIWLVLIFAAFVRVGYACRQPNVEWDASFYRTIAHHLIEGHGYTVDGTTPCTEWAPATPYLLAVVYRLGGGDFAARMVWVVLGTLAVWAMYGLASERYSVEVANLAALGMATYPYNILVGGSTSTEIPNILLCLLGLWAALKWCRTGSLACVSAAGVCFGLGILNRPANAALLPVVAMAMLLESKNLNATRKVAGLAVSALCAVAIVLPWCVRTSRETGKINFVTSCGPMNLWYGMNPWVIPFSEGLMRSTELTERINAVTRPDMTQAEKDGAYRQALRRFLHDQTGEALRLLAYKAVRFWAPPGFFKVSTESTIRQVRVAVVLVGLVCYVPVLLLSIWAVLRVREWRQWRRIWIWVAWITVTFASNVWFTSILRYRFAGAVDALMILLASIVVADHLGKSNTASTGTALGSSPVNPQMGGRAF